LLRNCGVERVIVGTFSVENQLHFSAPRPGIHRSFP
jgi:hypothetical protein